MNTEAAGASKDPVQRLLDWSDRHRRHLTLAAIVIAAIGGGAWFTVEYHRRKEAAASAALDQASASLQSGNLPLAASDLSRLVSSYGGTSAADEAVLLLAQVRLLQKQGEQAAQELQSALQEGLDDQYVAPAYSLLGAAQENAGNLQAAAQAYERAAETCWYPPVAAEYLNDAGRAYWNDGELQNAIADYQKVVDDHADAPAALEAKVRLGELKARLASRGT